MCTSLLEATGTLKGLAFSVNFTSQIAEYLVVCFAVSRVFEIYLNANDLLWVLFCTCELFLLSWLLSLLNLLVFLLLVDVLNFFSVEVKDYGYPKESSSECKRYGMFLCREFSVLWFNSSRQLSTTKPSCLL